ncbi:MAG: hypothetical protein JW915_00870 [Chitinispirillaceae bacterium]|nr:hypothetical protein [Chitinispirillaceae bacterium]
MIQLCRETTIYILSPANSASGGQEALHELGYYLKRENINVMMAYYGSSVSQPMVHPKFCQYDVPFCSSEQIPDDANHVLICPEAATMELYPFMNIRKVIWWLSVGFYRSSLRNFSLLKLTTSFLKGDFSLANNILTHRKKLFRFDDQSVIHLNGSFYTAEFIKNHGAKPNMMVQPLGLDFQRMVLNNPPLNFTSEKRQNVVLYNPSKGSHIMKRLMRRCTDLKFIPLKGFSPSKLIELFQSSKLYVDFGKFPGPERLPKEAVVNGCCIITGRRGAAAFYGDVRIPEKYKIHSGNIKTIHDLICSIFTDYETHVKQFEEYRAMVYGLENGFIQQIRDFFRT